MALENTKSNVAPGGILSLAALILDPLIEELSNWISATVSVPSLPQEEKRIRGRRRRK
jgi:hypothetical protein